MKIKIFAILLLLSLHVSAQSEQKSVLVNYAGPDFKLQYPSEWRLDTSRLMGTELFLFSPKEGDTDAFLENVSLIIQDLKGQNVGLEQYKQITDQQLSKYLPAGNVIESAVVQAGETSYYKTRYTMPQGKLTVKIYSICLIRNEKAYLLTFSGELDSYTKYQKVGEGILHSFVWTR
jgi:serine/threonine-protein kinase